MPHGTVLEPPEHAGQAVLLIAVLILILRIAGWMLPDGLDRFVFDPVSRTLQVVVDVFWRGSWVTACTRYRRWHFFCPLDGEAHERATVQYAASGKKTAPRRARPT